MSDEIAYATIRELGARYRKRELSPAGDEAEAAGREEDGDVDALHLHRHHLRLGVVAALDGEVQAARVGKS